MIIPSIDIINGKVVRLYQGKYSCKTIYKNKIRDIISDYCSKGISLIHLVDLDGASNPKKRQVHIIQDILSNFNINLQVGGGIRSSEDVRVLFELGVTRIVVGSSAIHTPDKVDYWLKKYGSNRIVLALDLKIANNGCKEVVIDAWRCSSGKNVETLINRFTLSGLKYVLCTDVLRDGTLFGPNFNLYRDLSSTFKNIHFQASGGIGSLKDIILVKQSGVRSVIVGRALLEKKINLIEAIKCWQNG